jgi:hypothetical protein
MRLDLGSQIIELSLQVKFLQLVVTPFLIDPVVGKFYGSHEPNNINNSYDHGNNVVESEGFIGTFGFRPDVLVNQENGQFGPYHVKNNKRQAKVEDKLKIFFGQNKFRDQKIDGKISDDDV